MLPIGIGVSVNFFRVYHESPSVANLLLVFSNATIFLQDWVMFSGVKNNELIFATNFWNSDIVLYQGLLIPQAWSLGVELIFYLIAPFVLARRKALLLLLVLSIGTRIYLIHVGLGGRDPWTYRFFPAELALFLLGALAHQLLFSYYKIVLPINRIETYAKISTYALIFITLVYWLIPINELIKSIVLIAVFLLFMPLAFIFQSKRNWDRWIGDLSYSIYICHMFVINISIFFLAKLGVFDKVVVCIVAVLLSIICSIILNIYIATPMELLRNHFRVNKPT